MLKIRKKIKLKLQGGCKLKKNNKSNKKKIVKNEFNLCYKGGDPYENPIFPAYVPEKNKITTPVVDLINFSLDNHYFVKK